MAYSQKFPWVDEWATRSELAHGEAVLKILGPRGVAQVRRAVVGLDAVAVGNVQTLRPRSVEGQRDKAMHSAGDDLRFVIELHADQMIAEAVVVGLEDVSSRAADAPEA